MEEAEIAVHDPMGIAEWIEIGSPPEARLKKATNAARKVTVYSTVDADGVLERARKLPRAERVTVHALYAAFVDALAEKVAAAGGRFALVRSGGYLYATCDGATLESPLVSRDAAVG